MPSLKMNLCKKSMGASDELHGFIGVCKSPMKANSSFAWCCGSGSYSIRAVGRSTSRNPRNRPPSTNS